MKQILFFLVVVASVLNGAVTTPCGFSDVENPVAPLQIAAFERVLGPPDPAIQISAFTLVTTVAAHGLADSDPFEMSGPSVLFLKFSRYNFVVQVVDAYHFIAPWPWGKEPTILAGDTVAKQRYRMCNETPVQPGNAIFPFPSSPLLIPDTRNRR